MFPFAMSTIGATTAHRKPSTSARNVGTHSSPPAPELSTGISTLPTGIIYKRIDKRSSVGRECPRSPATTSPASVQQALLKILAARSPTFPPKVDASIRTRNSRLRHHEHPLHLRLGLVGLEKTMRAASHQNDGFRTPNERPTSRVVPTRFGHCCSRSARRSDPFRIHP